MLSDIERSVTNNGDTRKRTFNVKLLNNELPVLEKLKTRFPLVYENSQYIRCGLEDEDQIHVFTCSQNEIDIFSCKQKLINLLVNKITLIAYGDTCRNLRTVFEDLRELYIPQETQMRDINNFFFTDIILGFISISIYDIIIQKVLKQEIADEVINSVFDQFKLYIYKQIWKPRCAKVRKWEIENNIGHDKHKRKICREMVTPGNATLSDNVNFDHYNNSLTGNQSSIGVSSNIYKIKKTKGNNNKDKNNNNNNNKNKYMGFLDKFIYNHIIKEKDDWTFVYKIGCSAGP
jgi:hypothetical protein